MGVNQEDLFKFGAVSKEIIEQMATNGRERLGVDLCIATSGIAGPEGGTEDKPVGSVWIALATKEMVFSKLFLFGDNRERNIHMTALTAMNLVRCQLEGISFEKN